MDPFVENKWFRSQPRLTSQDSHPCQLFTYFSFSLSQIEARVRKVGRRENRNAEALCDGKWKVRPSYPLSQKLSSVGVHYYDLKFLLKCQDCVEVWYANYILVILTCCGTIQKKKKNRTGNPLNLCNKQTNYDLMRFPFLLPSITRCPTGWTWKCTNRWVLNGDFGCSPDQRLLFCHSKIVTGIFIANLFTSSPRRMGERIHDQTVVSIQSVLLSSGCWQRVIRPPRMGDPLSCPYILRFVAGGWWDSQCIVLGRRLCLWGWFFCDITCRKNPRLNFENFIWLPHPESVY